MGQVCLTRTIKLACYLLRLAVMEHELVASCAKRTEGLHLKLPDQLTGIEPLQWPAQSLSRPFTVTYKTQYCRAVTHDRNYPLDSTSSMHPHSESKAAGARPGGAPISVGSAVSPCVTMRCTAASTTLGPLHYTVQGSPCSAQRCHSPPLSCAMQRYVPVYFDENVGPIPEPTPVPDRTEGWSRLWGHGSDHPSRSTVRSHQLQDLHSPKERA